MPTLVSGPLFYRVGFRDKPTSPVGGRIVTTDFLLNRIWPLQEAREDRLHVHVHRLRGKIEQDPNNPVYILAERGIGYTFRTVG